MAAHLDEINKAVDAMGKTQPSTSQSSKSKKVQKETQPNKKSIIKKNDDDQTTGFIEKAIDVANKELYLMNQSSHPLNKLSLPSLIHGARNVIQDGTSVKEIHKSMISSTKNGTKNYDDMLKKLKERGMGSFHVFAPTFESVLSEPAKQAVYKDFMGITSTTDFSIWDASMVMYFSGYNDGTANDIVGRLTSTIDSCANMMHEFSNKTTEIMDHVKTIASLSSTFLGIKDKIETSAKDLQDSVNIFTTVLATPEILKASQLSSQKLINALSKARKESSSLQSEAAKNIAKEPKKIAPQDDPTKNKVLRSFHQGPPSSDLPNPVQKAQNTRVKTDTKSRKTSPPRPASEFMTKKSKKQIQELSSDQEGSESHEEDSDSDNEDSDTGTTNSQETETDNESGEEIPIRPENIRKRAPKYAMQGNFPPAQPKSAKSETKVSGTKFSENDVKELMYYRKKHLAEQAKSEAKITKQSDGKSVLPKKISWPKPFKNDPRFKDMKYIGPMLMGERFIELWRLPNHQYGFYTNDDHNYCEFTKNFTDFLNSTSDWSLLVNRPYDSHTIQEHPL